MSTGSALGAGATKQTDRRQLPVERSEDLLWYVVHDSDFPFSAFQLLSHGIVHRLKFNIINYFIVQFAVIQFVHVICTTENHNA